MGATDPLGDELLCGGHPAADFTMHIVLLNRHIGILAN